MKDETIRAERGSVFCTFLLILPPSSFILHPYS